jgi:hypothetical protein
MSDLTHQERMLVKSAFARGPAALLEAGITPEGVGEFMRRAEVQAEFTLLAQEFDHQDVLSDRTKFMSRRELARLVPGATALLARALAGPVYARNADGTVQLDPQGNRMVLEAEPTALQQRAAEEILDTLSIKAQKGEELVQGKDLVTMFYAAEEVVNLQDDPNQHTEEQRALSREKVRNAIEVLTPIVVDLKSDAEKALTKKKKKRAPKKKKKPTDGKKPQS